MSSDWGCQVQPEEWGMSRNCCVQFSGPTQEALPNNTRRPRFSPPTPLTSEGDGVWAQGGTDLGSDRFTCCHSLMYPLRQVTNLPEPHVLCCQTGVTPVFMALTRHSQCRVGQSRCTPSLWFGSPIPCPPTTASSIASSSPNRSSPQCLPMACYMPAFRVW